MNYSKQVSCDYSEQVPLLDYEVIWVSNYRDIPLKGNYRAILSADPDFGGFAEIWTINGYMCRLDGPSHIIGTSSWWLFSNETYEVQGPTIIDGKEKEEYFIYLGRFGSVPSKRISKEEWLREQEIWIERQRNQEIKDLVI